MRSTGELGRVSHHPSVLDAEVEEHQVGVIAAFGFQETADALEDLVGLIGVGTQEFVVVFLTDLLEGAEK